MWMHSLHAAERPDVTGVERFLRRYTAGSRSGEEIRYRLGFADLNGDGRAEAIVYLLGGWCGSGGCTTLILTPSTRGYRLLSAVRIVHLPIRVLHRRQNGWRSLSVRVHGGGITRAYDAELAFDGQRYPANPTIPPARQIETNTPGEVVIRDDSSLRNLSR